MSEHDPHPRVCDEKPSSIAREYESRRALLLSFIEKVRRAVKRMFERDSNDVNVMVVQRDSRWKRRPLIIFEWMAHPADLTSGRLGDRAPAGA